MYHISESHCIFIQVGKHMNEYEMAIGRLAPINWWFGDEREWEEKRQNKCPRGCMTYMLQWRYCFWMEAHWKIGDLNKSDDVDEILQFFFLHRPTKKRDTNSIINFVTFVIQTLSCCIFFHSLFFLILSINARRWLQKY